MSSSIWIAYITEGREKYEYNTHIVGLFKSKQSAVCAVIRELVKQGRLDFEYDEHNVLPKYLNLQEQKEEYDTKYIAKKVMEKTDWTEDGLKSIIAEFEDSYYQDGWEYAIEKREIN